MIYSTNLSYNSALKGPISYRLFSRREMFPPRHDTVWRIEQGAVRTLTWNGQGTFITLGYWGCGDLIGSPLSRVKPYQIQCLTNVEVTIVPPHLWYQDINALLSHIQQAEELLSIVHCKPMSLRLWQFLVWLSIKFGRDVEQGKLIDINTTHQEMSEVLNTTRVTITRLLQKFEKDGTLLRSKRQMILRLTNK